jgi:hypothetical protein
VAFAGRARAAGELVIFFTRHLFLKALSGPVFRNSYVTDHLWHEIARWPRGSVFIDGTQSS